MKISLVLILIVVVGFIMPTEGWAQCAMCKATIEANHANQGKYGVSLNSGILYLMVVPYIAFSVLGYFWYKNARSRKISSSVKN